MRQIFRGGIFAVKIISANMPPHFYRNYAPPPKCVSLVWIFSDKMFLCLPQYRIIYRGATVGIRFQ